MTDFSDYDAGNDSALADKSGCYRRLAMYAGIAAATGLIAFGGYQFLDDGDDDGLDPADDQQAVSEDAGADDILPDDVGADDAGSAPVPVVFDIEAESGDVFSTTFTPSAVETDKVLIAAPSLNSDEDSFQDLVDELTGNGCASVVSFDASLNRQLGPFEMYEAVIRELAAYGISSPAFSTLGASFTGLDALSAAELFGGEKAYVFSPSQENPLPPPDAVAVDLYGSEDDVDFVATFNQWVDQGYEGHMFPGSEHGTAMFQSPNGPEIIEHISDDICP